MSNCPIVLHSKLGLIKYYLERSMKKMQAFTPEDFEKMPSYVKTVLPNVIHDCERNVKWLDLMQKLMLDPNYQDDDEDS